MRRKELPAPSLKLLLLPETDSDYVHFENGTSHPFDSDAHGLSRVNAWWLADAALLAYWDEAPARPIWRRAGLDFKFLSREGVQCHIAWTDTFVVVAFRGTQPDDWRDLLAIATVDHVAWEFGGGGVHRGFRDAFRRIWPAVAGTLEDLDLTGRTVWLTGHSMGGPLAALAHDLMPGARGLYTIGSPPIGDERFATGFDERHAGHCFRHVNHHDLVVYLPSFLRRLVGDYTHIHEERHIDAHGRISSTEPTAGTGLPFLLPPSVLASLTGHANRFLSVPVPDSLVDHTPRHYAVHVWNDLADHTAT
jgi:triacylglycerol lipase